MSRSPAILHFNSDWGVFQLTTEGAYVEPDPSTPHFPDVNFTGTGVTFGQPNLKLEPRQLTVKIFIVVDRPQPTVAFITGKGDGGVHGPRDGRVTVVLADREYVNTRVIPGGFNFEEFYNAPLKN